MGREGGGCAGLTDEVLGRAVEAEDVAAAGGGVLREERGQRLEHGQGEPVAAVLVEVLDHGVEVLGRVLHHLGVVLESDGHEGVA